MPRLLWDSGPTQSHRRGGFVPDDYKDVLGRIAAQVTALPRPGDECVVTGLAVGGEGRKAEVHTSLYGADGALLGRARATWVALATA